MSDPQPIRLTLTDGTPILRFGFRDADGTLADTIDVHYADATDKRDVAISVLLSDATDSSHLLFGEAQPSIAILGNHLGRILASNRDHSMQLETPGSMWGTNFHVYPPNRHPELRITTA